MAVPAVWLSGPVPAASAGSGSVPIRVSAIAIARAPLPLARRSGARGSRLHGGGSIPTTTTLAACSSARSGMSLIRPLIVDRWTDFLGTSRKRSSGSRVLSSLDNLAEYSFAARKRR